LEKKANTVACTQLLRDAFTQHDHASAVDSEPITASNPNDLAQCSTTAAVSQQPYQKRVLWSRENRDVVFKKFASFVRKERTPIAEIESTLLGDPHLLRKLENDLNLSGKMLFLAVREKVRSFFRGKYGYKKY